MCENMDNTHARRFDDTVRRRAGERGAIMTLRDCPRAMRVVVDGIDLDDRHRFRLCEIGLAPGAGLRVMQPERFRRKGRRIRKRTCRGGRRAPRVPSGYGSRGMNMRKTTLRNAKRTGICANVESTEPEGRRLLPFAEWLVAGIALVVSTDPRMTAWAATPAIWETSKM